jgi:hypothetical protein
MSLGGRQLTWAVFNITAALEPAPVAPAMSDDRTSLSYYRGPSHSLRVAILNYGYRGLRSVNTYTTIKFIRLSSYINPLTIHQTC